jgi:hypothetical protein
VYPGNHLAMVHSGQLPRTDSIVNFSHDVSLFDHLATAAFRAFSVLCSAVRLLARAFPPFLEIRVIFSSGTFPFPKPRLAVIFGMDSVTVTVAME